MGLLDSPNKSLNPAIWDSSNKLLPEVKSEILSKLKILIPEKLLKQAWFIGSSAGLQYNKFSDIDINVITRIPRDRENVEELNTWHQHFKYHNKQMDFLTGTKHPINYFVQYDMDVNWGDETTSIYLIKDYNTGEEDRWEKPYIPYEKIRDPKEKYAINSIYAKMYSNIIRNRIKDLYNDLQDYEEKKSISKLKELEDDLYRLIQTYKDVDMGRKLQYGYGWGVPKYTDRNFLFKYLERENLLELLSDIKDKFKKK